MTGKRQAREGHDRIMPKKDMAEIVKVGQVCMITAQRMPQSYLVKVLPEHRYDTLVKSFAL